MRELHDEMCKLIPTISSHQLYEEEKNMLNHLMEIALEIGRLRNKYSPAHGKGPDQITLEDRMHAELAVNAMSTVGIYLLRMFMFKHE